MKLKSIKSKYQNSFRKSRKLKVVSPIPINAIDINKNNYVFPEQIEHQQYQKVENLINSGGFHEAILPILVVAQFFAILPVVNITSKNPWDLYFSWKSFRCIFSIIVTFTLAVYTCITMHWAFRDTIAFARIVPVIFYASNTCVVFCFIFLAKKWPDLMKQWHIVECKLPKYRTQKEKKSLAYKLKFISIIILIASLAEHLLSIMSTISQPFRCGKSEHPIQDFFKIHLKYIFSLTSFSPIKAIIAKSVNLFGTFAWSFMDLFVILISIGLSAKFQQINNCLFHNKGRVMPQEFWATHRTSYRKLCNLCEVIDNAMAIITIVSFSNDLYFICIQCLNSLNPRPSTWNRFYFWFSLLYLICRTLAVSLYAADIYTESKRPMAVFRAVPSETWCLEVKRFSAEVVNEKVALSGMKFFYLTKGLILSVTGTIITYEIVLIQFREDNNMMTNDTIC